ncbi:MAG: hypothetical protein K0S94_2896 [Nitrospira sp.]|nr:hypothetical protein [Nitrospira sp.]
MDRDELLAELAGERDRLWDRYLQFKDVPAWGVIADAVFRRHQQTCRIWDFVNDGQWPKG